MSPTAKPTAYSYIRFSSRPQEKGDSIRRQTAAAEEYAQRHGLKLDEELKLTDLGVSAFKGANAKTGALAGFLKAIEDGLVPKGSFLLIEHADRLSRLEPLDVLPILQQIASAGLTVVAVKTGAKFSRQELRDNPHMMFLWWAEMMGAHSFSKKLSERLKSSWSSKRATASDKILTSRTPNWIEKRGDKLVLIRERATIVRRIFSEFLSGSGKHSIAERLNAEHVPCFGTGKLWYRSYIAKILNNPATVGTLTPHIDRYSDSGRLIREAQTPIPDYYPAVIDADTFDRAQTLLAGSRSSRRSGRGLANILAGLAKCPKCEGTMTRISKGSRKRAGQPFLLCVKAKLKGGCDYRAVKLADIEAALRREAHSIPSASPHPDSTVEETHRALDEELYQVHNEIEHIVRFLKTQESRAMADELAKAEARREMLRVEFEKIGQRAIETDSKLVTKRVERLAAVLTAQAFDRGAINTALRECFERIVVGYDRQELELHWRHGSPAAVIFYSTPLDDFENLDAPKRKRRA